MYDKAEEKTNGKDVCLEACAHVWRILLVGNLTHVFELHKTPPVSDSDSRVTTRLDTQAHTLLPPLHPHIQSRYCNFESRADTLFGQLLMQMIEDEREAKDVYTAFANFCLFFSVPLNQRRKGERWLDLDMYCN